MSNTPAEQTSTIASAMGGSGLALAIWKTIDKWLDWKRRTYSAKALTDMAAIYDGLNELQSRTKSGRVLLIYCSNGGGIPSAGKPVYCTILYEVKDSKLQAIRTNWQNVPLDEGYTKLMADVITKGSWNGMPSQLHPGFLKDLYTTEGVQYSMIEEIARTKERYYYIACRWYDITQCPPIPQVESAIQVFKNNYKKLLMGGP